MNVISGKFIDDVGADVRRGRSRAALAAVVLILAAATLAPTSTAAEEPSDQLGPDELTLVSDVELSTRLHELTFTTPALAHPTSVRVLLPDDFDASGATRYPVLFLLHGGGDDFRSWTTNGEATEATAGLDLIVVMPDNNEHGNYVDWYNAGRGGPPMWETMILDQLLPWIDQRYPTVGTRDGRAVAGLSMGGGGAMGYATRHPDLFTAAAAWSGAVDTNTLVVQFLVMTSGVQDGAAVGAVHGDRLTNEVRWRGHNPWDLAINLDVGMLLHLRTGNGLPGGPGGDLGDPVEFLVREQMVNLHRRLAALGVEHVWDDYGAGGHNWFYWRRGLRQFLPELMDRFARPVPAPKSITFRAIEDRYSVFGWDVSLDRRHVEFSTLVDASTDGFTLRGTGSATVVTPPTHTPGSTVTATVADRSGTRDVELVADDDGRLHVDVDLGPSNPYQQYTLSAHLWLLLRGGAAWPSRPATVTFAD